MTTNDKLREALIRAATNCPHTIDDKKVVLYHDVHAEGHNALNQLSNRLSEALAASKQEPTTTPSYPPDDGPLTDEQIAAIKKATSKQEPQAQAEPAVVAYRNPTDQYSIIGKYEKENNIFQYTDEFLEAHNEELITLQAHREAMAKLQAEVDKWSDRAAKRTDDWHEAIAKKDAALDACALPESYTGGTCLSYPGRRAEVTLHFSSIEDADRWFAAITSTKDTP